MRPNYNLNSAKYIFCSMILLSPNGWASGGGPPLVSIPSAAESYINTTEFAKSVDPFIGTAGDGNTYPGAVLPWGMVSVSPQNTYTDPLGYLLGEPPAPAGYYFASPERAGSSKINGFGQTHLSGVGCPELGAPVIAAVSGNMNVHDYSSHYTNEVAFPGVYSVQLNDFNIKAELTATTRVGVHRFTFPADRKSYVGVDVAKNLSWASHVGYIEHVSAFEMVGWSKTGNFCNQGNNQKVYFSVRTNIKPQEFGTWGWWMEKNRLNHSGDVGGYWRFASGQRVEIYVGVSYVSVANAQANLNQEMESKDFDDISLAAIDQWESTLGRIAVSNVEPDTELDKSNEHRKTFYTALYHSLLNPSVISDVNGDFPLYKTNGTGNDNSYIRYSIFGLWDSYRSLHSLLSLAYPQVQQDMLRTLEAMTLEAGHAPQWELLGSEVNMMVGDPALIVFAEGYRKGFQYNDIHALYDILLKDTLDDSTDNHRRPGNALYHKFGYVPQKTTGVWGSVSTTLEYSFADWALAQLADALGDIQMRDQLLQQADGWQKLYDPATRMLRPRGADGKWMEPFDTTMMKGERLEGDLVGYSGGPGYVEGNAWHYAFMVPHALPQLINLHGGAQNFKQRLASLFDQGHFTLWNEPDIASPYLFSLADDLPRTQQEIINARDEFFSNAVAGIPGNDDTGALSSWYVFSAMGFYPVNPVNGEYRLGIPSFKRVTIKLDKQFYAGDEFTIKATGELLSPLPDVTLNNIPIDQGYITHEQITAGGVLEFNGGI